MVTKLPESRISPSGPKNSQAGQQPSKSAGFCAAVSFFIPGLGQMLQGRFGIGISFFFATIILWVISLGLLGWMMHMIAAIEAALWKTK